MAVYGSAELPAAVRHGAPAGRSAAVESPLPEEEQAKAVAALSAAAATAAAAAAAADAARHSALAAPAAAAPAAAEPAEAAQQPADAEAPSAATETEAPDAAMAEAAPVVEQATEAAGAAEPAAVGASTAADAAPAAAAGAAAAAGPARVPARALYGLPVDATPATEQPQRGEGPAGAERPPHLPYLPRTEDDGRLPAYALGLMDNKEWQGDAAAVRVRKGDHSEEDPPPGIQPVDVFIGARCCRHCCCGCLS